MLYTMGHSDHSLGRFIGILKLHQITAVADVRSRPFSRISPQFCKGPLKEALKAADIWYVPLGKELGARRVEQECYEFGKAKYDRIRRLSIFWKGIERLKTGLKERNVTLLCAERDPIFCHRMVLVTREFRHTGQEVRHIRFDGSCETNQEAENRLLKITSLAAPHLFESRDEKIERAYDMRAERIAYVSRDRVDEVASEGDYG